ncbi:hypothetical protein PUMCH_004274 [Australozyma saopauloensis]|uniref:Zn(2)-C6 fungal-type domain-containing protein n=1 Tax=Australozyma saopauloensis TaxID=291208 RepID=A0AAX4HEG0_9ASCO|nr:hypothetical protein PUMCH_004274 [[Candida] saopauloensis]
MTEVKIEESPEKPKVISTSKGWRVSQACDRCRMKKVRCDGGTPCTKCLRNGLECTTSDKLSRQAFPKGYTVNLERRVKELEQENQKLKALAGNAPDVEEKEYSQPEPERQVNAKPLPTVATIHNNDNNKTIQINNPIDQIFNLDQKGLIIGNDNLNFESQFNHLLINLHLPFLKITNSHNFLVNDPDSYLYHPSYSMYNSFHNKDLELLFNPLSVRELGYGHNESLPSDVYDLFIKLINNFKKLFNSKRELDNQVAQFFLNYNTFIPVFDYHEFMQNYDAFHTMYPFMFTYDDATINGFNLSTNDYSVVNKYLMVVIQLYAMILMNDPSLNLNLLLNHSTPNYTFNFRKEANESIIRSLYDFLPYLNVFHVSMSQLQTYLLFLYYSLLTNNKEKSLLLSSLINALIGIMGVNLNSKNLFFNDLSLTLDQRRNRVKIFWGFKVLLKCFNLKFGFKPTINTTVINPVTIERYFRLTPEKLSQLIDPTTEDKVDPLFETLLKPSVEFLNLMNIIIPSSFSPNYYQYLKQDRNEESPQDASKKGSSSLDWILNDDGGDGNDGNLNYNYAQFLTIDKNLSNWRYALKDKIVNTVALHTSMDLPILSNLGDTSLYHRISFVGDVDLGNYGITEEGKLNFANKGLPDVHTAVQLIKIQLNFHYLLIRSMNYLNFVNERELTHNYYVKIANISREVLAYFILIFKHIDNGTLRVTMSLLFGNNLYTGKLDPLSTVMSSGLDVDDDGIIVNDFSAKRRRLQTQPKAVKFPGREVPLSPFNSILNGLSLTIINFKKSIVLQMLFLLICNLKIAKRGGLMSADTRRILNDSIALFIEVFINYQPLATRIMKTKHVREDFLFTKIINDELKDDFLKPKSIDDDYDEDNEIDWDDEDMDEDLKYLKILKYIKYKTNVLYEKARVVPSRVNDGVSDTSLGTPSASVKPAEIPVMQQHMQQNQYGHNLSPPMFPQMASPMFPVPNMAKPGYHNNSEDEEEKSRKAKGADGLLLMRNDFSNWHSS